MKLKITKIKMIIALRGKKYGVLSTDGKELVPFEYKQIDITGEYIYATTNDENRKQQLIKQLPQHLQNGEFMLTFVDANTVEFSTLGNVLRDGKNVKGIHPMLVYAVPINGEYVDIYLGMFHSPNNSEHVATTNATSVV